MKKVFAIIVILLMSNCFSDSSIHVPLMEHNGKTYLSVKLNYKSIDLGSNSQNSEFKLYLSVLEGLRGSPKIMGEFYFAGDGSRGQLEENLKNGFDLAEMYPRIKNIVPKGIIRWGDYHSLIVDYEIKDKELFPWREDFVCVERRCYLSSIMASMEQNQIFEVAYKIFIDAGGAEAFKKKVPSATNLSSKSIKFYPAWQSNSADSKAYPLVIQIDAEKYHYEICLNSDAACNENSAKEPEKELLNVGVTLEEFLSASESLEDVTKLVSAYDQNFNVSKQVQILRWRSSKPEPVYVDFRAFVTRLSKAESITSLGYIRSDNFLYLIIKNIDSKKIEGELHTDILLFKVLKDGELKLWFNTTGEYTENIIYSSEMLEILTDIWN